MHPRELFVQNLPLIERVIAHVSSKGRLFGADVEDFASAARLALIQNNYTVLSRYDGRAPLAAYLAVVLHRLLGEERNRKDEGWHHGAEAQRTGSASMLMEKLLRRDRDAAGPRVASAAISSCPSPHTLARFAAGQLAEAERIATATHLEGCHGCTQAIEAAVELLEEEERNGRRGRQWWLAAAAALLMVAVLAVITVDRRTAQPTSLTRADRIIEPRLSGFRWAPYRGSPRPAPPKIGSAAAEAAERAHRDRSPATQQAAGVAMLLAQRPDDAVALLRQATQGAPDDARVWNDLAAAQTVAAAQLEQPLRLSAALVAADRALRIEPASPEALFNRALVLERLGPPDAAREAWQRYLEVDPSSPWADEAQAHRGR
jgi:tetratricopeptide (TPR) repeat protein